MKQFLAILIILSVSIGCVQALYVYSLDGDKDMYYPSTLRYLLNAIKDSNIDFGLNNFLDTFNAYTDDIDEMKKILDDYLTIIQNDNSQFQNKVIPTIEYVFVLIISIIGGLFESIALIFALILSFVVDALEIICCLFQIVFYIMFPTPKISV